MELATLDDLLRFVHGDDGVYQTRMLSVLRYWIEGRAPEPAGVTNVEENSQIAYYVT